jgi:hypothetical protein
MVEKNLLCAEMDDWLNKQITLSKDLGDHNATFVRFVGLTIFSYYHLIPNVQHNQVEYHSFSFQNG